MGIRSFALNLIEKQCNELEEMVEETIKEKEQKKVEDEKELILDIYHFVSDTVKDDNAIITYTESLFNSLKSNNISDKKTINLLLIYWQYTHAKLFDKDNNIEDSLDLFNTWCQMLNKNKISLLPETTNVRRTFNISARNLEYSDYNKSGSIFKSPRQVEKVYRMRTQGEYDNLRTRSDIQIFGTVSSFIDNKKSKQLIRKRLIEIVKQYQKKSEYLDEVLTLWTYLNKNIEDTKENNEKSINIFRNLYEQSLCGINNLVVWFNKQTDNENRMNEVNGKNKTLKRADEVLKGRSYQYK
jgi:hypothetical protein